LLSSIRKAVATCSGAYIYVCFLDHTFKNRFMTLYTNTYCYVIYERCAKFLDCIIITIVHDCSLHCCFINRVTRHLSDAWCVRHRCIRSVFRRINVFRVGNPNRGRRVHWYCTLWRCKKFPLRTCPSNVL